MNPKSKQLLYGLLTVCLVVVGVAFIGHAMPDDNPVPTLSDREFMILLTGSVIGIVIGVWGAVTRTLQKIQLAADLLVSRTALLEEHVRLTTPEAIQNTLDKDAI